MAAPPPLTRRSGTWGEVRSRSIWRWQLIFTASAVAILVAIALLEPRLFAHPRFGPGAVGLVVVTCAALVIPWHRLGPIAVLLLPVADIILIGMLSASGETRMALLWVFPIAWIATYYGMTWVIAGLGVIAVIITIDAFTAGLDPGQAQRVLIILLCLGFMGITIHVGSQRTRAYSRLLRRQSAQMDRTRRRAETQAQRTAVLANTLETGLARIDRDGVLLDANAAFLSLFGAEAIATFSPTGAVEYSAHRGVALAPDATFLARAARGERVDDERAWLHDAQGRWRALDVSMRPVVITGGEPPSNLIVVRDVTAAVQAEHERQTVAMIVSHELRNPLTAILGHTDLLLERDDLPEDVRRQLTVVDNAGQRMQRLITSSLQRYTSDAPELAAVDLRPLVEASIVAFSPSATAAQVALTMDLGRATPVLADAFRLRQAVDNTLGNAVKYTGRGGTVHVSAAHTDTHVVLTIADTGIGMSPEDLERMFEPGYRSRSARDSGIPGTGLGMSVVKEIVDQHGGTLEVASALGRGTSVVMRLPRATEEERSS